jgi:hypothetical protein
MEGIFARAGEASPEALDMYARIASSLRRLLEAEGLQRRARQVGSFLDGTSTTIMPEWSPLRDKFAADRARKLDRVSAEIVSEDVS